ncbi:hypothetical protein N0V84_004425 [Fusarium piperis]|uniref:Uncharacterized protein n=1 Tax=Fusarium piperis TaxID=1435070 RepID=A0A9W8WFP4_9HYPO|nr:hypothetical protein N0V84_004425 [Fusarium piperis]
MPDQISDEARRAVNDALINSDSAVVAQLVDTANSSKQKRELLRKEKEEADRRKKEEEEADRRKKEEEEKSKKASAP